MKQYYLLVVEGGKESRVQLDSETGEAVLSLSGGETDEPKTMRPPRVSKKRMAFNKRTRTIEHS